MNKLYVLFLLLFAMNSSGGPVIPNGSVTTAKIAANAVTGAKLNSNVVDASTLQYTSSQLSVAPSGIGTSQIAANAVTQAKRAALSYQQSSSSGNFTTSSSVFVQPTNQSVTITTTGRPVVIGLESDGSANQSYFYGSSTAEFYWEIKRGSTLIAQGIAVINIPVSVVTHLDSGASSGSTTYTFYMSTNGAGTVGLQFASMYAYEL